MRAMEFELTRSFPIGNPWEGAKVGQTDFDRFMLHLEKCTRIESVMIRPDLIGRFLEHADPISNEMTFTRRHIVKLSGQRCSATTAFAVAHDQNFADIELCDCKFER